MKNKNLTVITGAEATELLIEGKNCRGIRYQTKNREKVALARREVILCCGTANTPKLLELSGIGNPEIIRQHGIEVKHELLGVGENLRDHYAAVMKWRFNNPGISIAKKGRGWRLGIEVLRYALFRKGFISQGLGTMRAFVKSRPDLSDADILIAAAPFIIEVGPDGGRRMSKTEGFFMFTHPMRPESMGSIHIRSNDPADPPAISYRFLQTEEDRQCAIAAIRRAREIAAGKPFREHIAEEIEPGPTCETDDEILDYMRDHGTITHHMIGTCRMGNDPMAVVDDQLRVHGVSGLRIADASIMPTVPSGNTSIPCMLIGEKCAELILGHAA